MTAVTWVVFDLGETLVDETANWDRWADHLGVPRFTFHAVFGAVIASGRPHTDVFEYFRPGSGPRPNWVTSAADLYDDALPALEQLRASGYRLAIFANQPRSVEPFLATLPVDRTATSQQWGVAKPDPKFFARMAGELAVLPAAIAYVGDRVDNDVVPAHQAGMRAVHIRRGPWGILTAESPGADAADARIESLLELPTVLAGLAAG